MIYFFTKGTRSAGSSRHRAYLISEFLNKLGETSVVIPPPVFSKDKKFKNRLEYLKNIFSLRKKDTVILQTTIFNPLFIFLMVVVKFIFWPKIIFDFDDAIYIRNPLATKTLALIASKVIVASHFLAKWPYIKNKEVLIFPNMIDYELVKNYTKEFSNDRQVVLGWIGGAAENLNNLKILTEIFKELVNKDIDFKFKLIGSGGSREVEYIFSQIDGLDYELINEINWQETGEIQKANMSFDIGLAPLVNNEDNQARCSLKVLDYMAVGLPVVASSIGENNFFIDDTKTGFLPQSIDQWVSDIEKLINDINLRKEIGLKAKEKIKKNYSYQEKISDYQNFIKS